MHRDGEQLHKMPADAKAHQAAAALEYFACHVAFLYALALFTQKIMDTLEPNVSQYRILAGQLVELYAQVGEALADGTPPPACAAPLDRADAQSLGRRKERHDGMRP